MDQITLGLDPLPKKTRKEVFLEEMNQVVPWAALVDLIGPHARGAHQALGGRPPFAVERGVAAQMLADVAAPGKRVTVGADKAYDTKGFVKACRQINVTPHVAQNLKRNGGSAIDGRTTRHPGYEVSQRKRKHIEQCFGCGKLIGPIRQVMVRGLDKVDQLLTLTMAAYNLTRLRTLAQLRPECAQ